MERLRTAWLAVSGSLWFLPSLVVLGALVLAAALIELESVLQLELASRWPRLFGAGASGSGSMLSAIATSMMTVAGVVFSVTLVALQLTATQYSPRVIRTFMNDRPTQLVLGVFVAVFAYCLLVLRTIRSEETGDAFVPSLAVFGGMVLALVAVGFLVFYIHHLAVAIEGSSILARLAETTADAMDERFPADCPAADDHDVSGEREELAVASWVVVPACGSGYVVSVEPSRLLQLAERMQRIVRMEAGMGDFVVDGQPLATLSAGPAATSEECAALNACWSKGRVRNIKPDPVHGIQQIVDVALKALSSSVNDQTTTIMCIDRLAEVMTRIADRRVDYRYHRLDGALRLIAVVPTFEHLLELAFDPILRRADKNRAVLERLQWALRHVMSAAKEPARVAAVTRLATEVEAKLRADEIRYRPGVRQGQKPG